MTKQDIFSAACSVKNRIHISEALQHCEERMLVAATPFLIPSIVMINFVHAVGRVQVREKSRASGSCVQWTSSIHQRPSVRISVKRAR